MTDELRNPVDEACADVRALMLEEESRGLSAFEAQYSARPERVEAATPSGKPALRFNGAANNPNRLTCKADSALTTAEGASLSWVLVLKPGSLSGTNDTYLQTTLDGRNYAWGVYRDAKGFHAEVRATAGARHISTLPIDALADHATGTSIDINAASSKLLMVRVARVIRLLICFSFACRGPRQKQEPGRCYGNRT